ncbi:MAG: LytR C-terminal domain-containing protein [Wujia sp.]
MKRQSPVGLFFSMFLRAVVVILGVAIVIFGIFFLTQVVKRGTEKAEPETTVDANVLTEVDSHDDLLLNPEEPSDGDLSGDDTSTTETPQPEVTTSYDKKILVLNGAKVSGLAAKWSTKLNGYGYANVNVDNYNELQSTTRIVAVQDGVGKDLMEYFNNPVYEVGTVTENVNISTDGYDIVIILGTSDVIQ